VQGVKENHRAFIVFATGVGYSSFRIAAQGLPMALNRNFVLCFGE
jgi:hypothetical protein